MWKMLNQSVGEEHGLGLFPFDIENTEWSSGQNSNYLPLPISIIWDINGPYHLAPRCFNSDI
ncbi:hypothetical protein Mapa_002452 [Marchantia paleacea]|nr:hypothetical protein Mapa_002452 [Marchantia paleacea]